VTSRYFTIVARKAVSSRTC